MSREKLVKIFSVQYDAFLNELVRLFPKKLEIRLANAYLKTYTYESLLEEGSKRLSGHVETAILNRDVEGLVCLFPSARSFVDELTDENLKTIWRWIDLFVKIFNKNNSSNK